MVNLIKRMSVLKALLSVRLGPGAAILPPEVTRIHMSFAPKINDGHYGPRIFWRNCLPRLKYHNPQIPMTVERKEEQTGPALLTIHFKASPSADSEYSTETLETSTNTQEINMKHRTDKEILAQFMKATNAKPVFPNGEELAQIKEIKEQEARSMKDRQLGLKYNEAVKREQAILTQARGEVAKATE